LIVGAFSEHAPDGTERAFHGGVTVYRKGTKTMTRHLEPIRQPLEVRLKETAPTRALRESLLIDHVSDIAEMNLQAAEREITGQYLGHSSTLARRIRSAIERLNNGSYGVCLRCEENIASKRLRALPWAELCIQCQEDADRLGQQEERDRITIDRAEAA
jgi:DnaK suppressor protein